MNTILFFFFSIECLLFEVGERERRKGKEGGLGDKVRHENTYKRKERKQRDLNYIGRVIASFA